MPIYDIDFETMPREGLESIQLRRLQTTIERVYATVPFYKKSFDKAGLKPEDIQSLDDLRRIPFTVKQDLRDNYPYDMFAVPMEQVVRIHASSGTTGKPTVVGYTKRDINTWAELMARSLSAAGATPGDIIHNAFGYGLFTGGLGAHYGAEKLGASVIPVSGGNTKRQITIMKDFKPTILCGTPSYILHLAEVAEEMGVDFHDLAFKSGIFGAEPWTENMRAELEAKLDLKAIDIYGLSEVIGPGVSIECYEEQRGLHVFEDHFIVEVIDPDTLEPVPHGQKGELVFTSITKEAFPVIRYRTKDITSLNPAPCTCGRTHIRMDKPSGRTDDMLIIRGVNVFPSQIESVLMETKQILPHYQLEVDRKENLDTLTVKVEIDEELFSDDIKGLQAMETKISKDIKEYLGVSARVLLVEPKTIQRSQGKAVRVIDKRVI
ncbi:phenylacetate--CoA ligase family protein [Desulfospira joergensenii]|uniref:phenylacetate--CoA ligase family protein n=1 Tax=Desulfospira joergensenii TaxID=53329 RepID=UPI0003B330D4|nr:phenylacetate--CoA ligase [Desulfospira joergensenii]